MRKPRRKRTGEPRMEPPGQPQRPTIKFPLATVIPYGPDDKTITKIAVSIVRRPGGQAKVTRGWSGTNVARDENVDAQIRAFLNAHRVKTISIANAVLGCPHEEGPDFPLGGDCPFCPFWKGKQGSGSPRDERWDGLKTIIVAHWTGFPKPGEDG